MASLSSEGMRIFSLDTYDSASDKWIVYKQYFKSRIQAEKVACVLAKAGSTVRMVEIKIVEIRYDRYE